jgi:FlaG/FlaF family flagellin (archaellin)
VFNYTIHRKVALRGSSPVIAKVTGAVSLVIWITVIFCGLFFAFTAGGY